MKGQRAKSPKCRKFQIVVAIFFFYVVKTWIVFSLGCGNYLWEESIHGSKLFPEKLPKTSVPNCALVSQIEFGCMTWNSTLGSLSWMWTNKGFL